MKVWFAKSIIFQKGIQNNPYHLKIDCRIKNEIINPKLINGSWADLICYTQCKRFFLQIYSRVSTIQSLMDVSQSEYHFQFSFSHSAMVKFVLTDQSYFSAQISLKIVYKPSLLSTFFQNQFYFFSCEFLKFKKKT